MRRVLILTICIVFILSAVPVLAEGPKQFGKNDKGAWQETTEVGVTFYKQTRQGDRGRNHTKKWDSVGGDGARFSQPGRAEGRANSRSVIVNDPIHDGTQLYPRSKRRNR